MFTMLIAALVVPQSGSPIRWAALLEPGSGGAMVDISVSPHDSKRVLLTGDMLGIGLSLDRGLSWGPTFGLRSYEMASVSWHPKNPNVVWCGAMGGPYRSTDGGRNWSLMRTGMPAVSEWSYTAPIEIVRFDPANERRLLAFGGSVRRWDAATGKPLWGVIWESLDAGQNWKRLTTLTPTGSRDGEEPGTNIIGAHFLPGKKGAMLALLSGGGVLKSLDSGRTWKPANSGLPTRSVERLAVHPTNGNVAYLSLGNYEEGGKLRPGGVFVTRNGGATWTDSSKGLSRHVGDGNNFTARYNGLAISATDPKVLAVSETSWNLGAIYLSNDAGATWKMSATRQNIGNGNIADTRGAYQPEIGTFAGVGMGDVEIDPKDPKAVYGINAEYVLRTINGGRSWIDATAEKTGNGWRGRGYAGWCSRAVVFDSTTKGRSILTAMDAGRAWLSTDGMKSWRYGQGFPYPWNCGADAAFAQGNRAYGAYGQFSSFQGVGRSDDGGASWKIRAGSAHGLPELGAGVDPSAVAVSPERPDEVGVVIGGKLYWSTNGSDTFTQPTFRGGAVHDARRRGNLTFLATDSGVWRWAGSGAFESLGGPRPSTRLAIANNGTVFVTSKETERPGVWRLAAGKWTRLLDEKFVWGIAVDPGDPRRLVATTNEDPYMDLSPAVGVLMSADGGATWGLENAGLSMLRAHPVAFNPFDREELVLGSYGRGFFRARWPQGYAPKGRTYISSPEDEAWAKARPIPTSTLAIKNGSMTDGGDTVAEWTSTWEGRPRISIGRDTSVFRSAPASLRITGTGDAQGQVSQVVEASSGTKLRIRGVVRSRGLKVVNVGLQSLNASWTPIGSSQLQFASGDTDWTSFDGTVTVAAGAARAQLNVYIEGQGSAWLDDVILEEVP